MTGDARSCALCGFHVKAAVSATVVHGGSLFLCPTCITSADVAKTIQAMTFLPTR